MKKSLFLLMVSVTGVLLSNSCTKESTSKDNGMIQLTITAGLPDTKTVFSEQSGENPLTVNWKSGTTESFGIFVGTSSQVPNQFTANVTSDSKSAAFTGSIPSATANGTNLIAVYPYINTSTDPAAIPFDLSSQTGNGNNLSELATKLPMVASATYTSGTKPSFTFSNQVAILKMVLTLPVNANIKSVSYGGYNVHNKASLNATSATPSWSFNDAGIGLVTVTYATTFAVTANTSFTVYLAAFPETSNNATVLVRTDDNKEYSFNYTTNIATGKAIEAGKVYSMTKTLALNTGEFNYTGDGSSAHPFLISTPAQLSLLSTRINSATAPYSNSGIYYKQIADIALSETFTPIGTKANTFKGEYDGNSKSITGLSVNSTVSGLFGYNAGTVKSITVNGTLTGTSNIGGIAGYNSGTISSCVFSGSIIENGTTGVGIGVGGIVGRDYLGTITNCAANGTSITSSIPNGSVGGILGYAQGTKILHCTNNIPVSCSGANSSVGGLVGACDQISGAYIDACINTASVSGTGATSNVGGLLGYCSYNVNITSSTTDVNLIRGCINSGNVSCVTGYAGGLIGYVSNSGSNSVTNDSTEPYETTKGNSIISGSYSISGTVTSSSTAKLGRYCGYSKNNNAHLVVMNEKCLSVIGDRSSSARTFFTASTLTADLISKLNTAWGSTVYQFNSSGNIVAK